MNAATEQLITILSEGTVRAVAAIAGARGIEIKAEQVSGIIQAANTAIAAGYAALLEELKGSTEARMGDEMYRYQLNVACNEFAVKALKATGLLPTPTVGVLNINIHPK